ncbi:MAG: hypothetical protein ACRDKB_13165 [Actinomycetota bacterium]
MAEAKTLEIVDRDVLRTLLEDRPGPSLSLFHPTDRVTVESEHNSLRLKNLLSEAHDRLAQAGLRRPEIEELLEPLNALLADSDFWRHRLDGLAIYRASDFFRYYRLPFAVDERVIVGDRFHVKPLVPALASEGHFYILALSGNAVRLLRATRYSVAKVDLDDLGIPLSLAEALKYDNFERTDLQHHPSAGPGATGRSQSAGRSGRGQQHMFHGHGPGGEDQKNELLRFFQGVDGGISRLLGAEQAPIVLAGVDYLHPLYRQASGYRGIAERGIEGNPEQLSDAELHKRAWPLIEPHFRTPLERAKEKFGTGVGNGLASSDLEEVLSAAYGGRIESLFVRAGEEVWGTYDPAAQRLARGDDASSEAPDLLDLASKETLLHGGDVFLVAPEDMPGSKEVAAVFRF